MSGKSSMMGEIDVENRVKASNESSTENSLAFLLCCLSTLEFYNN